MTYRTSIIILQSMFDPVKSSMSHCFIQTQYCLWIWRIKTQGNSSQMVPMHPKLIHKRRVKEILIIIWLFAIWLSAITLQLLSEEESEATLMIKKLLRGYYQTYSLTATNDVAQRRAVISLVNSSAALDTSSSVAPPRESRHKNAHHVTSSPTPTKFQKSAPLSGTLRPLPVPGNSIARKSIVHIYNVLQWHCSFLQ